MLVASSCARVFDGAAQFKFGVLPRMDGEGGAIVIDAEKVRACASKRKENAKHT